MGSTRQKKLVFVLIVVGFSALIANAAGAFDASAPTSLSLVSPTAAPNAPLGVLDVFGRAQSSADRNLLQDVGVKRAIAALTAAPSSVPNELLAGVARTSDFRSALSSLGVSSRSIYFFKTDIGRICAGLTGVSAGCYVGLPAGIPADSTLVDVDGAGTGEPPLIWGITVNDVRSVDVQLDGVLHPAEIGHNAYFFQPTDPATPLSAFQSIRVTFQSGKVVTLPVTMPPTLP